jgi:ribosomal protein S18 acetylase RimI-like enzyme
MRDTLTIRKATPEDALPISQLIHEVALRFNAGPGGELAPWFLASVTPSAIAACIGDTRFNYLLGLVGEALAGVVAVRDATHVHHLFVAADFHCRGIATSLWERAKTDAKAAGNGEGFLVRSSDFAVPAYERFGFRVIGTRFEKDGMAFVPMWLKLGGATDP